MPIDKMFPQPYTPSADRYDGVEREFNRCGHSGVMLPKISLGFWHNFGGVDPYERSREIVCYAFDQGITHFDLANNYGPPFGSAEITLGQILKTDLKAYRNELFISTKAGYNMWPGPYGNWGSRKYLLSSLDDSLRRMQLDYVDLFYSHRYDPNTPEQETLQALVDAVRMGKALYVGISRWPLEATKRAVKYLAEHDVPLLIYQDKLNMLSREPQESGVLPYLESQGVGFISFSPLQQGLLTNRYLEGIPADSRMGHGRLDQGMLTPELLAQLRQWNEQALAQGQSLAQMAVSWVLAQRGVTSVIVGASSVDQLRNTLQVVKDLKR